MSSQSFGDTSIQVSPPSLVRIADVYVKAQPTVVLTMFNVVNDRVSPAGGVVGKSVGVLVGGMGVGEGGTDVSVGGTGTVVSVGGTGVGVGLQAVTRNIISTVMTAGIMDCCFMASQLSGVKIL